jgi:competence protein ComEA
MKKWLGGLLIGLMFSASVLAAVNLNTATQSELESVKGIGPAKAKSIIDHRQKNGPFKTVESLSDVKGFGKASVDKVKDQLAVSGSAPAAK